MTRVEKMAMYDRACFALTEYEQSTHGDGVVDMYIALVEITNNWEEITGEDE